MSKVAIQGNASGSGVLTIAAPNTDTDRTLTLPDNTGTIDTLQRAGNVLQVVSATKTDTFSSSSTSMVDITGLSVSITPTSASSKILVSYEVCGGQDNTSTGQDIMIQLVRNSTPIGVGTTGSIINASGQVHNGGATSANIVMLRDTLTFLDSPATTATTTYKLQGMSVNSGLTWFINRRGLNASFVFASSITVMEIAA